AAGYVSVPLDPKLGAHELGHVLADAAPKLCVAAEPAAVVDRAATIRATCSLEPATSPIADVAISGTPALILYTSGTTGAPKGALIPDRNLGSNLDMLAHAWAWTDADDVVHALPLFHVHGLVLGLFGSLRRGGMLHWVPRFAPAELAAAIADHGPRAVL